MHQVCNLKWRGDTVVTIDKGASISSQEQVHHQNARGDTIVYDSFESCWLEVPQGYLLHAEQGVGHVVYGCTVTETSASAKDRIHLSLICC